MPARNWILTDVDGDRYVESLEVGPADVDAGLPKFSLRKRTLRGGARDGVDVVEVDNGRLRATLIPTRGMGIHRAECNGVRLGWTSPVHGPVHPRFVPQDEASGIGWLSGFDEFLVRCGLEYLGAPEWNADGKLIHPLHGRIANLPAHRVEASIDPATREITVVGTVDEARLFANKLRLKSTFRTTLGSNAFTITDEITNLSRNEGELELLYHINQGPPLAAPGSKFAAAVKTLVPRNADAAANVGSWQTYPPAEHVPENVFFFELVAGADGWTKTLLSTGDDAQGLAVSYDVRQCPLFTLWRNPLPYEDGYVTGLEPCINLPNVKSFEKAQGRVAMLEPDETRRFDLRLEVLSTKADVAKVRGEIETLQRGTTPKIFDRPQQGWSPV
jgi:hypothetical protein